METLHVVVFSLATIFLLTLAPAYAQDSNTTDSDAARTAAFFATNPTGDFNATGTISSLVTNETSEQTYILGGDWNLLVSEDNITNFEVDLTMVSVDGTDRHTHTITNFRPNAVVPVILDVHGTVFTGVTDMDTNGKTEWSSIQTTVTIARQDAIEILLNSSRNLERTDNHFNGSPIYGIVFSIQDYES